MSRVRFLLDENQSPRLRAALFRLAPTLDVLRVGDSPAPVLGTPDVELLRYLEATGRILVTSDRTTMPGHIQMRLQDGGHLWGIFWVRSGASVGRLAETLRLVWEATEASEWIGREDWIPF
jgi:hypothetical protein